MDLLFWLHEQLWLVENEPEVLQQEDESLCVCFGNLFGFCNYKDVGISFSSLGL